MDLTSNEPFWLIKNGLVNNYPSLKENIQTEILIVGGGITGSLMAHQCMEDGFKTTLIDRREIANGSSSATTSMLQYEIDTPLYKLTELIGKEGAEANFWAGHEAIDELESIVKQIQSDCGFKKKESLYYAAYKKDVPNLLKEFEARKTAGFNVQWLSEEEILKKYKLHNAFGGILTDQGGSIDAFRFAHDLLKFNMERGLNVFDKTNLENTAYKNEKVIVTTNFGNTIEAEKIIYCNGYESTEMIKEKFVNLLSSFVIIGEPNEEDQKLLNETLFWDTAEPYIYLRTTDDNRLLIGGEDEDFKDPVKRDQLIGHKSQKLKKKLEKIFPDYQFRTDFSWAGTFGETKDGLPYIGEHPDFKNSYFVLGFGGNGITFSITGKKVISDFLHHKIHPLAKYFEFRR
ncbi:MAG: FAD-dependent oxidoreductase [Crocinitomicaceae bacterium]|nr:FAD-dependent oxidoreductase [Crocinitomicaceae bacterium]